MDKLTDKRDEFGDYDVFLGAEKVAEIYKSAFASWWVIEAKGRKNEGYATLKDAKADLPRFFKF